jgi:hypothetical protein
MSARRDRLARAAELASEDEERAKARWAEASHLVRAVDREREVVLQRATALASQPMPTGLRTLLVSTGARHLLTMSDRKAELMVEHETARAELERAMVRTRSLERVVARQEAAERLRRQRAATGELQDLVAVRAAHRERSRS